MSFSDNNNSYYLPFGHTTTDKQLEWKKCLDKLSKLKIFNIDISTINQEKLR